ncbi:MAG: AmpG family muropeptide MFS transporter [Pseudobdellovibrio sp.]
MSSNTVTFQDNSFFKKLFNRKQLAILLLGFASGLPLAMTGQSFQAWLTVENIDLTTIGFLTLVGLPYTFKFLWAPLMDRFEFPFLGRRKGWLVATQLLLAAALFLISLFSPQQNIQVIGLLAVLIAFLSASQDIVIDAYRTDVLESKERGFGSSLTVFGYRLAMILSGGVAFTWADPIQGKGYSWPKIYVIMACIMLVAAVVSFIFVPPVPKHNKAPETEAKNDLIGFLAVVVAVAIGYQFTQYIANPLAQNMMSRILIPQEDGSPHLDLKKWADMISLLLGITFTLPLAWFASKKAKFETLNTSLKNYFSMKGAGAFLALIILYKLGDSFAGSLLTPFLLKGVGYTSAEIGVVNKVFGMWLTIFGAILGGSLMVKLGLYRSLFLFGVLQLLSNFGFWYISLIGKNAWGTFDVPAFDLVIVSLKEATNIDWLLLIAVSIENLTGGMGTAAFVAFLMALCNQKFTATQYALLSAFSAVGRVWVGPLAGVLVTSIGWPKFFMFSVVMAIPGLFMIFNLRHTIKSLESPTDAVLLDD